jgi:hypothetical protein
MCFLEWIVELFSRLEKHFVPNHHVASVFGDIQIYFPLDNANMLRLRKLQCYNFTLYSSF